MENIQSRAEQEHESAQLFGEGWRWYSHVGGYLLLHQRLL